MVFLLGCAAKPVRRDDDDADNDADGRNDLDGNNASNTDGEPSRSKTPIKRKRVRKQMCTITKGDHGLDIEQQQTDLEHIGDALI